ERFEEVADLGRRERVDQPAHGTEAAAVERVGEQTQLARGFLVADGFGHAGLPVAGRARGRDRVRRSWRELWTVARDAHTPAFAAASLQGAWPLPFNQSSMPFRVRARSRAGARARNAPRSQLRIARRS